jgi:predicted RNase H-like HicB family nuclease
MSDDRYPANVFWSDEDEGYIAVAPDLPGCSAFGDTEADALAELKFAIEAWKEAAVSAGNTIPRPSMPVDHSYSGKFIVRMPKSLHRELALSARDQNVSLNQFMIYLLSQKKALI